MDAKPQPVPYSCRLYTAEKSREIDHKTITQFGVDSFTLMETAAIGASSDIGQLHGCHRKGLYLCGSGNNAGDALAVARHLVIKYQHNITIWFLLGTKNLSPDAQKNLQLLEKLRQQNEPVQIFDNPGEQLPDACDYIVDGVFGTGLTRPVESPLSNIFDLANHSGIPVYAMDIPSGLNSDNGKIFGTCIKAKKTYTFGTQKIGTYLEKASLYTGPIHYIDLHFPRQYRHCTHFLLNETLYNTFPGLSRHSKHKYDGGVVHIVAGSEGLTGAAIIAAKSAWKNGAGAVFLYSPKKLLPVYEVALPNIIKIPVGDADDSFFKPNHTEQILDTIHNKPGVLLAGPGLGSNPESSECLHKILNERTGFTIIDADGLRLWDIITKMENKSERWLFTPHAGEAKTYMNAIFSDDAERIQWVQEKSNSHKTSILMKGNPSILSVPENELYVTAYDTSMFTRAGFGDYLAGAIAAQTSLRNSLKEATLAVMYESYQQYQQHENPITFSPDTLL